MPCELIIRLCSVYGHDEHLIIRVELAAVFACIDADDLEALAADAELLSDRAHRAEEILAQRLADHTYSCAALAVRLCQVAPRRDRHASLPRRSVR